jgi:hypothetical protein
MTDVSTRALDMMQELGETLDGQDRNSVLTALINLLLSDVTDMDEAELIALSIIEGARVKLNVSNH